MWGLDFKTSLFTWKRFGPIGPPPIGRTAEARDPYPASLFKILMGRGGGVILFPLGLNPPPPPPPPPGPK
jgi:hypothetical protein